MIDSLTSWRDTVARKPGCRIPRYASFTPDLQARLTERFGSNLAEHFGMDSIAGVALKPPPGYEAPDFSSYYEGRDVPADMVISADGVGKTLAGFYHFFGFIHPLVGAETVADIEAYLNDLTTVRARFSQANADGSYDTGILWLWRPGKARIEYSPPTDILVVADGTWLIYFDAELDQVSYVPIDTGPFRSVNGFLPNL